VRPTKEANIKMLGLGNKKLAVTKANLAKPTLFRVSNAIQCQRLNVVDWVVKLVLKIMGKGHNGNPRDSWW